MAQLKTDDPTVANPVRKGRLTSEFWVAVATSVTLVINQALESYGIKIEIPMEAILPVVAYIVGRPIVKAAEIRRTK